MQKNLHGITLIEMMVALVLTLVIMGTVVTVFGEVSNSVAFSRAGLEMADRLRLARNTLQNDLANCTCPTIPWRKPESNEGYFEYYEGAATDLDLTSLNPNTSLAPIGDGTVQGGNALGDYDDVVMMTVHNPDTPFIGRAPGPGGTTVSIESHYAEIAWYATQALGDANFPGEPGMRTVYRRVLLIVPSMDLTGIAMTDAAFSQAYDISSRIEQRGPDVVRVANTLGDLTKRENRFSHYRTTDDNTSAPTQAPYGFPNQLLKSIGDPIMPLTGDALGTDVMLTNVLAFDVRAYDPMAPVYQSATTPPVALVPGDAGWAAQDTGSGTLVGRGAYVDLGYETTNGDGYFSLAARNHYDLENTYCTWSEHCEHDGQDQDTYAATSGKIIDQGTNGLDDGGDTGIVDDAAERETIPPFSKPLRGIQVRLRAYEPDSRQIRQVSVVQSFVPL